MKWKNNARKIPTNYMRAKLEEDVKTFYDKPIITRHGKPWVVWDHTRDFCEVDDEGVSTIVASTEFKRGEYIFPCAYVHPRGFVGETKDARYTETGWIVYLDAILRNKTTGEPVKHDNGQVIDLSGWYRESDLKDAGLGLEQIQPGATAPSVNDLLDARVARAKRRNR